MDTSTTHANQAYENEKDEKEKDKKTATITYMVYHAKKDHIVKLTPQLRILIFRQGREHATRI